MDLCDRCKAFVAAPVSMLPHEAMMEVPKRKSRGNGNIARPAEEWKCFTCGTHWLRDQYSKDPDAKWTRLP